MKFLMLQILNIGKIVFTWVYFLKKNYLEKLTKRQLQSICNLFEIEIDKEKKDILKAKFKIMFHNM